MPCARRILRGRFLCGVRAFSVDLWPRVVVFHRRVLKTLKVYKYFFKPRSAVAAGNRWYCRDSAPVVVVAWSCALPPRRLGSGVIWEVLLARLVEQIIHTGKD